jgi:citronellol/citronellal dehydrogenase
VGKLDGKTAIVTGASRGIGKSTARLLAAEGAKVICASRSMKEGDSDLEGSNTDTVEEIKKAGGAAIALALDVTSEYSVTHCIEAAQKAFGAIDILVNNAVYAHFFNVKDMTVAQFDHTFATAVRGPFIMIQKVLTGMIKKHGWAIVNVSSAAAIGPGRGPYKTSGMAGTVYGATKASLERLTQGLAEEVYQYGIAVSAVGPGVGVATPFLVKLGRASGPDDPKFEPVEMMSKAILLLASEPIDKVTGRVTYSQAILKEFGWIADAKGLGIDRQGSGFSRM